MLKKIGWRKIQRYWNMKNCRTEAKWNSWRNIVSQGRTWAVGVAKKNSHRISRVRDNLSESITGFSPHNISEHVVSWKTRSNFFPNKVSVFIVIYADWWELTQKEERKFEGRGFSDASVQWTKIKSFSIFQKLLQMCFRTILTYDH